MAGTIDLCPKYQGPTQRYCFGSVYRRSLEHYQRNAYPDQIEKITRIAEQIAAHPLVQEVYGVGYPFYGELDIRQRMDPTVQDGASRAGVQNRLVQRLIPDVDLLVVFPSERGPYMVSDQMAERMKDAFVSTSAPLQKKWREIFARLTKEENICPRDDDPVERFMEQAALFVDLLPVPRHIWREIPNFVFLPEDLEKLQLIRDLMFTCQPLLADKRSDVPARFRVNLLLNVVAQKGEAALGTIWEEIIRIHPYRHLIENNQTTELVVLGRWLEALEVARAEGLLIREGEDRFALSIAGVKKLAAAREKRGEILNEGFPG